MPPQRETISIWAWPVSDASSNVADGRNFRDAHMEWVAVNNSDDCEFGHRKENGVFEEHKRLYTDWPQARHVPKQRSSGTSRQKLKSHQEE